MRRHAIAACAAAVLVLGSCGGGKKLIESALGRFEPPGIALVGGLPAGAHPVTLAPDVPVAAPEGFARGTSALGPARELLAQLPSPPRGTSALRLALRQPGSAFVKELPQAQASADVQESDLRLSPHDGQLAYALWRFNLENFGASGQPQTLTVIRTDDLQFDGDAEVDVRLWVALANVQTDRWEFFVPASGQVTLESFTPYTAADGSVLVALLAQGEGTLVVAELVIGQPNLIFEGELNLPYFNTDPKVGYSALTEVAAVESSTKGVSSLAPPSNSEERSAPLVLGQVSAPGNSNVTLVDLAPSYQLPRHQGETKACTAFATSAAISYELARRYGLQQRVGGQNDLNRLLSVVDIYSGVQLETGQPNDRLAVPERRQLRDLVTVLDWLTRNNVPREAYRTSLPYIAELTDKNTKVQDPALRSSPMFVAKVTEDETHANTKVKYVPVYDSENDMATRRNSISTMRSYLNDGVPLVFRINVDYFWDNPTNPADVWKWRTTVGMYSHAMVLVGYDDARQAFKVLNSVGRGWGLGGYRWIAYEAFEEPPGYDESKRPKPSTADVFALSYTKDNATAGYLNGTGQGSVSLEAKGASNLDTRIKVRASQGEVAQGIQVEWDQLAGANGYYIFRDVWPTSDAELQAHLARGYGWYQEHGGDNHSFVDEALHPGPNSAHRYCVVPLLAGEPQWELMSEPSEPGYPCEVVAPELTVSPSSGEPGRLTTFTLQTVLSCLTVVTWDFGSAAVPAVASGVTPTVTLGSAGVYPCKVTLQSPGFPTRVHNFTLTVSPVVATVSGSVLALDGTPVAGAQVMLFNPSERLTDPSLRHASALEALREVTSGPDGSFEITGVPSGTYSVQTFKSGWGFTPAYDLAVDSAEPLTTFEITGFTAPTVKVSATTSQLTAKFDAGDSFDADGGGLKRYRWDFDYDGTTPDWDMTTESASVSHKFGAAGTYQVLVQGEDTDEPSDAGTATLQVVIEAPPVEPPVAVCCASPAVGYAPLNVCLDASGSRDPDGGSIMKYEWDFSGDGSFDKVTTGAKVLRVYKHVGKYTVRLRVTDDEGHTDTSTCTVKVKEWCW